MDPIASGRGADTLGGLGLHDRSWFSRACGNFRVVVRVFLLIPDAVHRSEFVKQCLHCLNFKARGMIARPLRETVHRYRPREVMHCNSTTITIVVLREKVDWMNRTASGM